MITIKFMKPFYTKVANKKLRIVFAYQYFSILKDDEIFHFIPIEGKEIIINLENSQIENSSEVFVFQRGNRFIRLPLYQLFLVSNIQEFFNPILDQNSSDLSLTSSDLVDSKEVKIKTKEFISQLELENINHLIDIALDERNEEEFYRLLDKKKEYSQ